MRIKGLRYRYPGRGGFDLGPMDLEGPDPRPWLILGPSGRADPLDIFFYWADLCAGCVAPALMLHFGVALSKRTLRRPRTVVSVRWQVLQANLPNSSSPLMASERSGAPASQASYSRGSMTTTLPVIRECSAPQYSAQNRW